MIERAAKGERFYGRGETQYGGGARIGTTEEVCEDNKLYKAISDEVEFSRLPTDVAF